MQKIVLALVGLGVFAITLAGLFLFGPGGVSGAADPFLQALERRDFVAAAAQRTQRFQEAVAQDEFERFLSQSRVGLYASASWSGWQIKDGVGRVEGSITTATGEVLPLRLSFQKEDRAWKLDAIQPLRDGAGLEESALVQPTPVQAVVLIQDATAQFAAGVVASDFSALRDAAAPEFRAQFSVADLDAQFKPFVDASIDLRPLASTPPNLAAEPSVDDAGVLRLVGYYPADGGKVDFDYKYVYRYIGWRLVSLQVNVVPD